MGNGGRIGGTHSLTERMCEAVYMSFNSVLD